jgi:hypothetical protein
VWRCHFSSPPTSATNKSASPTTAAATASPHLDLTLSAQDQISESDNVSRDEIPWHMSFEHSVTINAVSQTSRIAR